MLRIDFYLQHLVRHNAQAVELASGHPVKFVFPTGERQSKQPVDHAQLAELVQEAAPPRVIEQLRSTGRARFGHSGAGMDVTVDVAARSAGDWVVRISPGAAAPADEPLGMGLGGADDEPVIERPIGGAMLGGTPAMAPAARAAPAPEPARRPAAAPAAAPAHRPVGASPGGAPAIDRLLRAVVEAGASDLHLSSTVPAMWRHDGEMAIVGDPTPLDPEALDRMLREIIPDRNREELDEKWDTDFAYTIEGLARFRVNYFRDRKGIGAVMRQIPFEIIPWEKLGLNKGVIDLCWLSKGLVLVTGPTGSGKSTTLASLVDYINQNRTDHIITIEDPIEFVHPNKKCLVNQREVGSHTKSFKSALRAALREDPDIVLVGELRDLETIAIAIETAETGHLVFGTLHTSSAKSTIDRIIDQFPADRQEQIRVMLAESLRGVVAQVLCKKNGGGRVAAYEILLTTPAISNLIREAKTFQITSAMQTGKNLGMQTMNDHLLALVKSGVISPEEAYVKSNDKGAMKDAFAKNNVKLELPST